MSGSQQDRRPGQPRPLQQPTAEQNAQLQRLMADPNSFMARISSTIRSVGAELDDWSRQPQVQEAVRRESRAARAQRERREIRRLQNVLREQEELLAQRRAQAAASAAALNSERRQRAEASRAASDADPFGHALARMAEDAAERETWTPEERRRYEERSAAFHASLEVEIRAAAEEAKRQMMARGERRG